MTESTTIEVVYVDGEERVSESDVTGEFQHLVSGVDGVEYIDVQDVDVGPQPKVTALVEFNEYYTSDTKIVEDVSSLNVVSSVQFA